MNRGPQKFKKKMLELDPATLLMRDEYILIERPIEEQASKIVAIEIPDPYRKPGRRGIVRGLGDSKTFGWLAIQIGDEVYTNDWGKRVVEFTWQDRRFDITWKWDVFLISCSEGCPYFAIPHPQGDRVLIKVIKKEEKTASGLYLPVQEAYNKEVPVRGKVLAVGPGRTNDIGVPIPMNVPVGVTVLYGATAATEVKVGQTDYLIVHQEDVVGILKEATRGDERREEVGPERKDAVAVGVESEAGEACGGVSAPGRPCCSWHPSGIVGG